MDGLMEKTKGIKGVGGERKHLNNVDHVVMRDIVDMGVFAKDTSERINKGKTGKAKKVGFNDRGNKGYKLATCGIVSFKGKNNGGKKFGESITTEKARYVNIRDDTKENTSTVIAPENISKNNGEDSIVRNLEQALNMYGKDHKGKDNIYLGGSITSRPPDKGQMETILESCNGSEEISITSLQPAVDNMYMQDSSDNLDVEKVVETPELIRV